MEDKENNLRAEFAELDAKLQSPDVYSDPAYPKLAKRQKYLQDVIALFDTKKQLADDLISSEEGFIKSLTRDDVLNLLS